MVVWLAPRVRQSARVRASLRESARVRALAPHPSPRQSAPSPRNPRVRIVRAGPSGPHGAEFPVGYCTREAVGTIPTPAVLYSNMLAQIRSMMHHIWLPGATKNKKLNKIIDNNKAYNQ